MQGRFYILLHYQWHIQLTFFLQTKFSLISQGFSENFKNIQSRRRVWLQHLLLVRSGFLLVICFYTKSFASSLKHFENFHYFQQQTTMDALAAGDAEEHEHCKTCVRMKCNVKPNWPDSCDVIDCENRCGMRLHRCKQIEHLQVKRIHLQNSNYRPQTKLREGYVFTGVCDSVHREGDGIPACLAGLQGEGVYPSMPCRFPGPHPRGNLRGLTRGGLQAHTQGGVSQHALRQRQTPQADGYCCGRYASYWNAFLLNLKKKVIASEKSTRLPNSGQTDLARSILCSAKRLMPFQYFWKKIFEINFIQFRCVRISACRVLTWRRDVRT